MRLLTWNINSVRLRLAQVLRVMETYAPDLVCLQETKCPDALFPYEAFARAGYPHAHVHGMKAYNGMAILSRRPLNSRGVINHCGRTDCRHVQVSLEGLTVHGLYVPAGGDEPDPAVNEKFAHKLAFVEAVTAWMATHHTPDQPLVIMGDFNIAPLENDVWSHRQLLNVVSHTPAETGRLKSFRTGLDWQDCTRHMIPPDQKAYTWWSYRNRDWRRSDRGRRLDHIWITKPLLPYLESHAILRETRDWEKPSDHVPVMIDIGSPIGSSGGV